MLLKFQTFTYSSLQNVSIIYRQPSILRIITRAREQHIAPLGSDKANIICTLCIVTWHYLSNVIGCHDNHCTDIQATPIWNFLQLDIRKTGATALRDTPDSLWLMHICKFEVDYAKFPNYSHRPFFFKKFLNGWMDGKLKFKKLLIMGIIRQVWKGNPFEISQLPLFR